MTAASRRLCTGLLTTMSTTVLLGCSSPRTVMDPAFPVVVEL